MPFKSKRQQRKFFAMEERGEIPKGTARRWARETPNIKRLPEKVKKKERSKKASLALAFDIGRTNAFEEAGLSKHAALGDLLWASKRLWAPSLAGAYFAGPEARMEGALLGLGGGALAGRLGKDVLRRAAFSPEELKILSKLKTTRKLKKKAPELLERFTEFQAQKPLIGLAAGTLGGAGAGYLSRQARTQAPTLPTTPAVSDMATHYAGLVPGEEYYI